MAGRHAVWTWLMRGIGTDGAWTPWPVALLTGAMIGSGCFAVWQLLALALRGQVTLISWQPTARANRQPADRW